MAQYQWLLLCILAVALPWEIFQRLPVIGITVVKVAGGLIVLFAIYEAVRRRPMRFPCTGIELPLAAFMVICAVSAVYSEDVSASLYQLRVYGTYVVLFYALVVLVGDAQQSVRLLIVFAASAGIISALSLLCAAGWLVPSLAQPIQYVGERVTPWGDSDVPVRMVAASNDFNGGVFQSLLALPFVVFLIRHPGSPRAFQWIAYGLVVCYLSAMIIAVSRSSLLVGVVVLIASIVYVRRVRWVPRAVTAGVLLLVVAAIAGQEYLGALTERVSNLLERADRSSEGRWYGYVAAMNLLPQYWLFGTGLNASDAVLFRSEYADRLDGFTLHSVPFKMLLELGIFGFGAFVWLIAQSLRVSWKRLVRSEIALARCLGAGFVAASASVIAVTTIQPFTVLSTYPFVLGLVFGPIAMGGQRKEDGHGEVTAFSALRVGREELAAIALVGTIVIPNVIVYQLSADRVGRFANALERAAHHEQAGAWPEAARDYSAAIELAVAPDAGEPFSSRTIESVPYASNAAQVFDLAFVYGEMGLAPDVSPTPTGAAYFGLSRTHLVRGDWAAAESRLVRCRAHWPEFAEARYWLGESRWGAGQFRTALNDLAAARERAESMGQGLHWRRIQHLARRLRELESGEPAPEGWIEAARLERMLGRWGRALELSQRAAQDGAPSAAAHYYAGIEAELNKEVDEAKRQYRTALSLVPTHLGVLRQLRRLEQPAPERSDGSLPGVRSGQRD